MARTLRGEGNLVEQNIPLSDVFGLAAKKNPLSYVRRDVENDFEKILREDERICVVIYGTSKQGKTSLRRSVLPDERCITLSCSRHISVEAIYREALAQSGAEVNGIDVVEYEVRGGIDSSKGLLSAIGLGANVGVNRKSTSQRKRVQVDLSYARSVSRILKEARPGCAIVIDNFHHASEEVQRKIATDLRDFGDDGTKIVILGTWRDKDYLLNYNSDLKGRISDLSIEPWSDADLERVLSRGEKELNIRILPRIKSSFIRRSEGNIGLLQTFMKEFLADAGIIARKAKSVSVNDFSRADVISRAKCKELLKQVTNDFIAMSKIGGSWLDGRTRMSYILDQFLMGTGDEISYGMPLNSLYQRVNNRVGQEKGAKNYLKKNFFASRKMTCWNFSKNILRHR
jgi:hypothetical protein